MLQTLLVYYFVNPFPSENNKPVYIYRGIRLDA